METPDLRAGIPEPIKGQAQHKTRGAADLCRRFMENEGWAQVFAIARGDPQRMLIRSKLTAKVLEVRVTPDVDQRIASYKLISAYGYGRPAELASNDDSGRTVTDLLLAALRSPGHNEAGPR